MIASAIAEHQLSMSHGVTRPTRKAPRAPLSFLVVWECMVVCVTLPVFTRMFAWFRLVRCWAAMRFDDHRGLLPSSVKVANGRLTATLVRTKTSGVGKKREELYICVSAHAYMREESWLAVGWDLWERVGIERDFFMGLPTPSLDGMLNIEAQYADERAMSRALMSQALAPDGSPLLFVPGAYDFWLDHSDRAFLTSAVGCLDNVSG